MISKDTAILFDFDGTLMDTESAIVETFREMFRRYRPNDEFTEEMAVYVLGPSLRTLMETLFPGQDVEMIENEYRKYQAEHLKETVKYMPYTQELVAWLKENGYKIGIVTTRKVVSLKMILELMHMDTCFDVLIGEEDVTKGKPSPEGILKACEMLQATKSVYVGDSITDVQAGKAANSLTVAFVSNEHKREALFKEQPDYVIDDLKDMIDIIKKEK